MPCIFLHGNNSFPSLPPSLHSLLCDIWLALLFCHLHGPCGHWTWDLNLEWQNHRYWSYQLHPPIWPWQQRALWTRRDLMDGAQQQHTWSLHSKAHGVWSQDCHLPALCPRFLNCKMGLIWHLPSHRLEEVMGLEWCLVHSRCSINGSYWAPNFLSAISNSQKFWNLKASL